MDLAHSGCSTVGLLGVHILSHVAFSTLQYRGLLQITEEQFSGPPNVVAELILGLVLCIYAALTVPGNFQSIHPSSPENRQLGRQSIAVAMLLGGTSLYGYIYKFYKKLGS